jgi:hypothetical protein
MKKLWSLFLLAVLVGCATDDGIKQQEQQVESRPAPVSAPPPAPPPPPRSTASPPRPAPPPPVVTSAPGRYPMIVGGDDSKMSMVVRQFLYPKDTLDKPYANIILFSKRPVSKAEREVYISICENWRASFPEITEVDITAVPKEFKVIRFYWLLKKDNVDTNSCQALIDNYDYGRAKLFLTTMKLKADKSQMVCKLPTGFVIMDISALRKDTDIELAIRSWQKHMSIVPAEGGTVRIYTLYDSIKAVLGAIGGLVSLK